MTSPEPQITEEQKFYLCVLAGCPIEVVFDATRQVYVTRLKNPVGVLWSGERWIIAEKVV